jgi:hypothetical protein
MNEPQIFISGTMNDQKDRRREIADFVSSLGYRDILWERGGITYDPHNSAVIEASIHAVEDADVVVLIVGERYGDIPGDGDNRSVTEREYDAAKEKRIPVYAFIQETVNSEYRKTSQPDVEVTYRGVEADLLRFVHRIYADKRLGQTVAQPFVNSEDITGFLKNQWASLFGKYLREARDKTLTSCLTSGTGIEIDISDEAIETLERNNLIKLLRDGSQSVGKPSIDNSSLILCLRQSQDLRSFCLELYRKCGYELRIDRMLLKQAEAAYKSAKDLVNIKANGFDIYGVA